MGGVMAEGKMSVLNAQEGQRKNEEHQNGNCD